MPNPFAGQLVSLYNYTPDATKTPPTGNALAGTGFRDRNGVLFDPSTVKCIVKDPTDATTTYVFGSSAIVKDAVGLYHLDIDTTGKPGNWAFAWQSPAQAYAYQTFFVDTAPL